MLSDIDLLLGDPDHWDLAVTDLDTLAPGQWLDGNLMSWFLWDHWLRTGETTKMWFLPLDYMHCCQSDEGPSIGQITGLRRLLSMPPREEDLPMRPVAMVMHSINHYFVVVFDYKDGRLFTFGRTSTKMSVRNTHLDPQWNPDNVLWTNVQKLFGWQSDYDYAAKWAVDWPQVIYHCLL
jgi:hypothetical protein